jgi:hypothetical protein
MGNNVFSINKRKFLGSYCEVQNSERIPEEAIFFTGVILSVVLPEIIYCVYGGPVPPIVFAGVALVGTLLGVASYHQQPYEPISCVRTGSVPQAPPSGSVKLKKVA